MPSWIRGFFLFAEFKKRAILVSMPQPIHTVAMYPRPHPDNIVALWLLREFGRDAFPGIEKAKLEFWNQVPPGKTADQYEADGVLLIDIGGGKFDHHQEEHHRDLQTCATSLVAQHLGVADRPELKKLLEYVRRDDLEGRGIVSKDPIDRAFGLSAIVMNLNRDYPDHPEFVIELVSRVVLAHYHEEYRRKVLMPQEWAELQQHGRSTQFTVPAGDETLRVVMIESDSKALVGFLRAVGDVQADVVVQRLSSGHTNIVTRQTKRRLNLLSTVAAVRQAEAEKLGIALSVGADQWQKPRRLEGIDAWYFDTAANTIQNGGAAAENVPTTKLSLTEIRTILERTLPGSLPVAAPRPRQDGPIATGPRPGPREVRLSDLRSPPA